MHLFNRLARLAGQNVNLGNRLLKRPKLFRTILTMKKIFILFIGFATVHTVRASVEVEQVIKGLPVLVVTSGKSYKVFEQYPWEGHSSNYGPKGNRLSSGYGVGVDKNIRRSLQVRHGDWIHLPEIGWRQNK